MVQIMVFRFEAENSIFTCFKKGFFQTVKVKIYNGGGFFIRLEQNRKVDKHTLTLGFTATVEVDKVRIANIIIFNLRKKNLGEQILNKPFWFGKEWELCKMLSSHMELYLLQNTFCMTDSSLQRNVVFLESIIV